MTKEEFVRGALKYVGHPAIRYRKADAGESEDGFDCSGFVTFLLRQAGFRVFECIRHSNEYFDYFGVFIHEEFRQKGDLVFFSRNGLRPTHMGIMISDSEYIHSPGEDGKVVTIAKLKRKIIKSHRRGQIYGTNPIAFKRLAIKEEGRYQRLLLE